jgi:tRNA (guanine-N7-)-methyltransferase
LEEGHVVGADSVLRRGAPPARPDTGLTEDGRRRREVVSYSRRGTRLTEAQTRSWQDHSEKWWIPDEVALKPFTLGDWFRGEAPLLVEIGSGVGEAAVALAAARPAYHVLAIEVWRPGVAETFKRLERAGVRNVRMLTLDAVWALEHLLDPGSVAELWTFFPDPWPKSRHRRRRLVDRGFARLAASRLASEGIWRLATDSEDYARQISEVLDAEPLLEDVHADAAARWESRPLTRFERRALAAGRPVRDFTYRRR